jgi:DNA-binding GntR family transcriptional regulator
VDACVEQVDIRHGDFPTLDSGSILCILGYKLKLPYQRATVRRQEKEATIVEALHRDISRGVLSAGAPLLQDALAARFGVSRLPIRDALKVLEADGVVTLLPNRTALVTPIAAADIEEIFAIRVMLETDLLRRATARAEATDHDAVAELCGMLDAVRTGERFAALDTELHRALYAPAARPRQAAIVGRLGRQVARFYGSALDIAKYHDACQEGHRAIVAAYLATDPDGAVVALCEHLRLAERKILDHLAGSVG